MEAKVTVTIRGIGQSAGNQRIVLDSSRNLRDYTQCTVSRWRESKNRFLRERGKGGNGYTKGGGDSGFLGPYLAGLIEGDGSIIVPSTKRHPRTNKKLYPVIKRVFAQFFQTTSKGANTILVNYLLKYPLYSSK